MLEKVGRWAKVNRMSFGISKCGVMVINGSMEELRASEVRLEGELVPVVEQYTYLGFPVSAVASDSYAEMLEAAVPVRKEKAKRVVGACTSFLNNKSIPLAAKVDLVRGMVFPVISYAGELLGMSMARAQGLESVWGKCVRNMMKGVGACGASVLMQELGLKHVFPAMSAMRARAFLKYRSLSTPAALFCSDKIRGAAWYRLTKEGLKRLGVESVAESELVAAVEKAATNKIWTATKAKSNNARAYDVKGFNETKGYVQYYLNKMTERLDDGMRMLIAARCNGLWTGVKAADSKLISSKFKMVCPCCKANVPETIQHILLHCSKWASQRAAHLSEAFAAFPSSLGCASTKTVLLLGGKILNIRPALTGWAHKSAGVPLFVYVARFFQAIAAEHSAAIWRHSTTKSRRPTGYGSLFNTGTG